MPRGSQAKQEILEKLKEVFPNSFMEDAKILRIPWIENGEQLEVKIQMTAAKNILGSTQAGTSTTQAAINIEIAEPTKIEKAEVEAMIKLLGGRIE